MTRQESSRWFQIAVHQVTLPPHVSRTTELAEVKREQARAYGAMRSARKMERDILIVKVALIELGCATAQEVGDHIGQHANWSRTRLLKMVERGMVRAIPVTKTMSSYELINKSG